MNMRITCRKCMSCGAWMDARSVRCIRCGHASLEETDIPLEGEVLQYTVISVPPAGYEMHEYSYVLVKTDAGMVVSGIMHVRPEAGERVRGKMEKGRCIFVPQN